MAEYGYGRVSTQEQHLDRQLIALKAQGIPSQCIFLDKVSGKNFNRPEYKRMIARLKKDDTVFILNIDRLGRSYFDLQEQWRILTKEKGVDIVVIEMPLLDTRRGKDLMGTFISDLVLSLLSYVSQNERDQLLHRQQLGIAAAKARGVAFGRPVKGVPDNFGEVVKQWEKKNITLEEAIDLCGMSKSSFYRRVREYKLVNAKKR